jgi:hypothetical protein
MESSWILRRVTLVRTDVSEELSVSIIRVTSISELRTLAVTSNRRTLRENGSVIYWYVLLALPALTLSSTSLAELETKSYWGSFSVASYDSQGYGESTLTCLRRG